NNFTNFSKNECEKMFKSLNDIINGLNNMISYVNQNSSKKYIKSYHNDFSITPDYFTLPNTFIPNKFYGKKLTKLVNLPLSFSAFNKEIPVIDINTVADIKKRIYEKYIPQ